SDGGVRMTHLVPLFLLTRRCARRDPRSFPTRRSSDLHRALALAVDLRKARAETVKRAQSVLNIHRCAAPDDGADIFDRAIGRTLDRKSTRLNSSHVKISYAVFCLKKKTAPSTCCDRLT